MKDNNGGESLNKVVVYKISVEKGEVVVEQIEIVELMETEELIIGELLAANGYGRMEMQQAAV